MPNTIGGGNGSMSDNIMMIGPSRAGKTTLLSVLRLASARRLKNAGRVRIRPVNEEAKQLFERTLDIAETGAIVHPANVSATKYVFELNCDVDNRVKVEHFETAPGKWPWSEPIKIDRSYFEVKKESKAFTLNVLDGKGGDIFGKPDELEDRGEYDRRRAELVEMATQSSALIVCVNASDQNSTRLFFTGLQRFLDEVHSSGVRTPFSRVAIALTQADRKVEDFGSSAQTMLEEMDPAETASATFGYYAKHGLFQALDPPARDQVYASWVSVYGFIPNEGSVNYDSSHDRIAIFRPDDARWTDDWIPYGVIEPFLFACTGEVIGLKKVQESSD
jgi:hypothetical protein